MDELFEVFDSILDLRYHYRSKATHVFLIVISVIASLLLLVSVYSCWVQYQTGRVSFSFLRLVSNTRLNIFRILIYAFFLLLSLTVIIARVSSFSRDLRRWDLLQFSEKHSSKTVEVALWAIFGLSIIDVGFNVVSGRGLSADVVFSAGLGLVAFVLGFSKLKEVQIVSE